mgnify:CR=1 FL=1
MGFFDRLGNIWKGFLSLWVSNIETRNPEAVYESAIDERVKKHKELKKAVSGIVYLRNKLSKELEDKEKTLKQLEKTVGTKVAEALAKENKRQMIAPGRPLCAGVPEE